MAKGQIIKKIIKNKKNKLLELFLKNRGYMNKLIKENLKI